MDYKKTKAPTNTVTRNIMAGPEQEAPGVCFLQRFFGGGIREP